MNDLRNYSINELSLLVFNTESLHSIRYDISKELLKSLDIQHTQEQWIQFTRDIASDYLASLGEHNIA